MAKDPAFLFYYQDFFSGVSDLTNEEVGAYIRCLCVQASKGNISVKHINNICGTHDVYKSVVVKFIKEDDSDMMFNVRLREEIEKRKKYADSRRNNRKGKGNNTHDSHMLNISNSYDRHMENENENENIDEIDNKNIVSVVLKKSLEDRLNYFKGEVYQHVSQYGIEMLDDFIRYWSEPNRANNPKMKFELNKTWSLSGRLATWHKNSTKFKPANQSKGMFEAAEELRRSLE